jgi:hypothetical protein
MKIEQLTVENVLENGAAQRPTTAEQNFDYYLTGNKGLYGNYNTCLWHMSRSCPTVTSDTPNIGTEAGKA